MFSRSQQNGPNRKMQVVDQRGFQILWNCGDSADEANAATAGGCGRSLERSMNAVCDEMDIAELWTRSFDILR
jgi:hypothetical protein